MTIRENSENLAGIAASLRLEVETCRRQLEECQRRSAQLAEENDRLRDVGAEPLRETKAVSRGQVDALKIRWMRWRRSLPPSDSSGTSCAS